MLCILPLSTDTPTKPKGVVLSGSNDDARKKRDLLSDCRNNS